MNSLSTEHMRTLSHVFNFSVMVKLIWRGKLFWKKVVKVGIHSFNFIMTCT